MSEAGEEAEEEAEEEGEERSGCVSIRKNETSKDKKNQQKYFYPFCPTNIYYYFDGSTCLFYR